MSQQIATINQTATDAGMIINHKPRIEICGAENIVVLVVLKNSTPNNVKATPYAA